MDNETEEREITVHVWRGDENGAYQPYQVPVRDSQTVLDVVTYIQRHIEPDLSYRYACRVGMCGTCSMLVQGIPRWTCRTRIGTVLQNDQLAIAPLLNLPVVKDLVVDMEPFFDKWEKAGGQFVPGDQDKDKMAAVDPQSPARKAADLAIECIGCGVCYAACDVVDWRPDYLGPAALNRVWTLVNDERDGDQAGHIKKVAGESGCLSCHTHESCSNLCPKHLKPTTSIAALKRKSFLSALIGRS